MFCTYAIALLLVVLLYDYAFYYCIVLWHVHCISMLICDAFHICDDLRKMNKSINVTLCGRVHVGWMMVRDTMHQILCSALTVYFVLSSLHNITRLPTNRSFGSYLPQPLLPLHTRWSMLCTMFLFQCYQLRTQLLLPTEIPTITYYYLCLTEWEREKLR